jgi:hypothetical protein
LELVKTHVAPTFVLSMAPTKAVVPSALTATEKPCSGGATYPLPTSFPPCCTAGTPVGVTVKSVELANVPLDVAPVTGPEVAPGMTRATSVLDDSLIGTAATPPMLTNWVVEKSVPVMVTGVPTGPEDGKKETTVAGGGGVIVVFEPLPQLPNIQIARTMRQQSASFIMAS